MPGRGVYGDAGGLVDDEQVLVLPRDAQARDRLGLETARATFRQFEIDLLAAGEAVALRPRRPRDAHTALGEQPFGRGARAYLRQAGEEAVEPFAGRSARHGDPDDDERVGEVEGRPEAEVEEVGDVPEADPVDQVGEAAADQ